TAEADRFGVLRPADLRVGLSLSFQLLQMAMPDLQLPLIELGFELNQLLRALLAEAELLGERSELSGEHLIGDSAIGELEVLVLAFRHSMILRIGRRLGSIALGRLRISSE